jgi:hypothetical protein
MASLACQVTIGDCCFAKFRCAFTCKVLMISAVCLQQQQYLRQTSERRNQVSRLSSNTRDPAHLFLINDAGYRVSRLGAKKGLRLTWTDSLDLCAKLLQYQDFIHSNIIRHDDTAPITLCSSNSSQRDTCRTDCTLKEDSASMGMYQALFFGIFDDCLFSFILKGD